MMKAKNLQVQRGRWVTGPCTTCPDRGARTTPHSRNLLVGISYPNAHSYIISVKNKTIANFLTIYSANWLEDGAQLGGRITEENVQRKLSDCKNSFLMLLFGRGYRDPLENNTFNLAPTCSTERGFINSTLVKKKNMCMCKYYNFFIICNNKLGLSFAKLRSSLVGYWLLTVT